MEWCEDCGIEISEEQAESNIKGMCDPCYEEWYHIKTYGVEDAED